MVQTFIENTPLEIATLRNYAKEEKWDQLGENAHRFAPSLQFLGLVSLRPVINQLEDFSFGRKNLDQISTLLDKLNTECILVSEELKKDFNL